MRECHYLKEEEEEEDKVRTKRPEFLAHGFYTNRSLVYFRFDNHLEFLGFRPYFMLIQLMLAIILTGETILRSKMHLS